MRRPGATKIRTDSGARRARCDTLVSVVVHAALSRLEHRPWALPEGAWDVAAVVARFTVRPLAHQRLDAETARAERARSPRAGGNLLDRRRTVSNGRGDASTAAGPAMGVGVPGAQREDVRRAGRETQRVVLQPGRDQPSRGLGSSPVLSPAVPPCSHVGSGGSLGVPVPFFPPRRRLSRDVRAELGRLRSQARDVGALAHRAVLPLRAGAGREPLEERSAPSPLAAPIRDGDYRRELDARAAQLSVPDVAPLLHFAKRIDVVVWGAERVG
jgi:hypothetical protein